jgi:hypothetical protein
VRGGAVVADEPPDEGPDLLLGISLIVLPMGPAAGEADGLALTSGDQEVGEELAAVVGVELA